MRLLFVSRGSLLSLILATYYLANDFVWSLTQEQIALFDERLNAVLIGNLQYIYESPFQSQFCFGIWNELHNRVNGIGFEAALEVNPDQASSSRQQEEEEQQLEAELVLPAKPDPTSVAFLTDVRDWALIRLNRATDGADKMLMVELIRIVNGCLPTINHLASPTVYQARSSSVLDNSSSFDKNVEMIIDEGSPSHLDQLAQCLQDKQTHIENVVEQQKRLVSKRKTEFKGKMGLSGVQLGSGESPIEESSKQVAQASEIIDKNVADWKKCAQLKERTLKQMRSFSSSGNLSKSNSNASDSTEFSSAASDFSASDDEILDQLNRCKSELLENEHSAKQAEFELEIEIHSIDRALNNCIRELDHIKMLTRISIMRFNESVDDEHKIH